MNCIDIEYIWQTRIHSGFTYNRKRCPFPDSAAIGLDFNVACKRKTKLDLNLLTNGVVLEVYDFSKTVSKSLKYMVSGILEYNFDTGVDNGKQRHLFVSRIFNKIRNLNKYDKQDEVFLLPDPKTFNQSGALEVLSRPDTDVSKVSVKSSLLGPDGIAEGDAASESVHADQSCEGGHVDEAEKGTDASSYPCCEAIGLDLAIRPLDTPKQKLDASLLTSKVILEVIKFVKMVCGRYGQIIPDVLKHNFDLDESCILETVKKIYSKNDILQLKAREAFRKMPCTFVKKIKKEGWKRRMGWDGEVLTSPTEPGKRIRKPKHDDLFCDFEDLPHNDQKCLTIDTEMDGMQETQMGEQSDTSLRLVHSPTTHRPFVPISSAVDGTAMSGQFSEDVRSVTSIEVTAEKQNLWRRRAMRTKQILSMRFKDKKTRLAFNVGSGERQNWQLLTIGMLEDIFTFANQLHRTQSKFTSEVFNNNFKTEHWCAAKESGFLICVIKKMKILKSHPHGKSAELLNDLVHFPAAYRTDGISSSQAAEAVSPSSATSHEASMEPYPFCMALGINLWAVKQRPLNEKLDLCVLTNGALLEVSNFVTKLCGTVWEVMYDVLKHNFHFDLQDEEMAEELLKWCSFRKPVNAIRATWVTAEQKICLDKIVAAVSRNTPDCKGVKVPKRSPFKQDRKLLDGELKHLNHYPLCKELGINLEVNLKREATAKLDLQVLTRAVVYEMHTYVEDNPQEYHYVPALYKILEDNFDLSSQLHRRCDFAMAIASKVKTMSGNFRNSLRRKGGHPNTVFELPFEFPSGRQGVCKEEPEDGYCELEPDDEDIEFVCKFIPVDIEIMLD